MFQYIVIRLIIIFIVVLIVITAGSLSVDIQQGSSIGHWFNYLLNQSIYYMPHAFLTAILIFFSTYLFKKNAYHFNKKVTKYMSQGGTATFFSLFFIGLFILGANFCLQEFLLPKVNFPVSVDHISQNTNVEKADSKSIEQELEQLVDYIQYGEYEKGLKQLDIGNLKKQELFVHGFLVTLFTDFKIAEDLLIEKGTYKIQNFSFGYQKILDRKYLDGIQFFEKQKADIRKYFIQKARRGAAYQLQRGKGNYKLKTFISFAKAALTNKSINDVAFNKFMKSIGRLVPNQSDMVKKLKDNDLDFIFSGDTDLWKRLDAINVTNALKSNIYFIDDKLSFVGSNNKKSVISFGKTLILFNKLYQKGNAVYLKDIMLLANIDYQKRPPVYIAQYGKWLGNRILVYNLKNLTKYKKKMLHHYIPDQAKGYFKLSESYNMNDLLFLNKTFKYTSISSIFDLYQFATEVNKKNSSALFSVYIANKLSYYGTTIILFFIFLIAGFIYRTRFEKVPLLSTKLILGLFFIGLTLLSFHFVKQHLLIIFG